MSMKYHAQIITAAFKASTYVPAALAASLSFTPPSAAEEVNAMHDPNIRVACAAVFNVPIITINKRPYPLYI